MYYSFEFAVSSENENGTLCAYKIVTALVYANFMMVGWGV